MEDNGLNIQLSKLDSSIVLSSRFRQADLIQQTALQIQKDFAEFRMEIHFSGKVETAYQELFDQIFVHLSELIEKSYTKLFNFLYRIDLSEKAIIRAGFELPEFSKAEIISHLIIQRELKKVLIRNYYKEKGSI